jgi:hypothetical protein
MFVRFLLIQFFVECIFINFFKNIIIFFNNLFYRLVQRIFGRKKIKKLD